MCSWQRSWELYEESEALGSNPGSVITSLQYVWQNPSVLWASISLPVKVGALSFPTSQDCYDYQIKWWLWEGFKNGNRCKGKIMGCRALCKLLPGIPSAPAASAGHFWADLHLFSPTPDPHFQLFLNPLESLTWASNSIQEILVCPKLVSLLSSLPLLMVLPFFYSPDLRTLEPGFDSKSISYRQILSSAKYHQFYFYTLSWICPSYFLFSPPVF